MKEIIGFKNILDGFNKRVENNSLSHAHLIVGPDGIGKSLVASEFATKILGKENNRDYVDIVNYRPNKASFGVDEVREIIEEVSKRPYEGDKKVIIIHEGDKLTIQAQNALLKTIEEPPYGVYIIMLSQSLEVLLDTIRSRCQIYKLTPLSNEEMEKFLATIENQDPEKLKVALAYSEGIPGRAEKILYDEQLALLRDIIVKLLFDLLEHNNYLVLEFEEKLSKYKDNKEDILNIITLFVRDIMIYKEISSTDKVINKDKINDIMKLSDLYSYKKLNNLLNKIEQARINIKNNVGYSMIISNLLIGFLEG